MNFSFLHLPAKDHKPEEHKMVTVYTPPYYYTNEGSEFLDDALRMKEQPLEYTVAPGATGGLNEIS
jgi:hypothetical protein